MKLARKSSFLPGWALEPKVYGMYLYSDYTETSSLLTIVVVLVLVLVPVLVLVVVVVVVVV